MSTLLLIRHASHDFLGTKLPGWMRGVRLNDRGRIEAARLAERVASLPLEAVYTSPLPRSVDTATPLAVRAHCPIHLMDALGEIRCEACETGRAPNRIPAGDSMLEVQAQGVGAIERLREEHPEGQVAVVTHGDVIRLVIAHYIGLSLDMMLRLKIAPASISALRLDSHGALLTSLNA